MVKNLHSIDACVLKIDFIVMCVYDYISNCKPKNICFLFYFLMQLQLNAININTKGEQNS